MKKFLKIFFIFSISLFIIGLSKNVKANSISKISMDIFVDNNGDAEIEEVWECYANQGTEVYHPYYNLGNSRISDLRVSEKGKIYTSLSSWDTGDSFDSKAYKCGINKISNGVELCWGISQYGSHTYTVRYTITNLVSQLDDCQMLYWTFIPYQFSNNIGKAYIKIHSDFKYSDDWDVWGYGNYGGTAYVYDGYIEMQPPKNGLKSSDYMTILVKFPANYFNTTNKINKSWQQIFDGAEKDTIKYDQEKEEKKDTIFSILFSIGPIIFIIVLTVIFSKNSDTSNRIKNKIYPKKDILPFRDLPFKDDYLMAYFISSEYRLIKKKTDLLGAVILKWIKDGNVNVTTEEKGIFKNKETKIELIKEPEDQSEKELYEMMKTASSDNILENKEFTKYCKNHYSKVLNWFDSVNSAKYSDICEDSKYVETTTTKTIFGTDKKVAVAKIELNEKASQLAGMKVFFKEFTSMHEKEAIEVKMWRDYLIYAQIFGMAKEVAKEFKDLYPDVITEETYNSIILIHDFSTSGISAANVARSRAQSYSSGGGGFSSGGGGGGSFGGGGGGGGFR